MEEQITKRWNDERVEQVVANLLRTGVIAAAGLVLVGGILLIGHHNESIADKHYFHREPPELCSVPGVLRDAWRLDPRGIIQLGLLVLVATPVARVAFSVWAFLLEKDATYVVITLVVLAILLCSLVGGYLI